MAGALAVWPKSPGLGVTFVIVGTMAGLLATAWTILMPLLGIAVVIFAIRDASRGAPRDPDVTPAA